MRHHHRGRRGGGFGADSRSIPSMTGAMRDDIRRSYDAESLAALAKAQKTMRDRGAAVGEAGKDGSTAADDGDDVDVKIPIVEWLPPPLPRIRDGLDWIPDEATIRAIRTRTLGPR